MCPLDESKAMLTPDGGKGAKKWNQLLDHKFEGN